MNTGSKDPALGRPPPVRGSRASARPWQLYDLTGALMTASSPTSPKRARVIAFAARAKDPRVALIERRVELSTPGDLRLDRAADLELVRTCRDDLQYLLAMLEETQDELALVRRATGFVL